MLGTKGALSEWSSECIVDMGTATTRAHEKLTKPFPIWVKLKIGKAAFF